MLLSLAGYSVPASMAGDVVWSDALPTNRVENAQTEVALVAAGIESKQTAAENLGLDWAQEQERMIESAASATNVGEMAITQFEQGKGLESLFSRPAQ